MGKTKITRVLQFFIDLMEEIFEGILDLGHNCNAQVGLGMIKMEYIILLMSYWFMLNNLY